MHLTKHWCRDSIKRDRPDAFGLGFPCGENQALKESAATLGDLSVHRQGTGGDGTADARSAADRDSAASRDLTWDGASSSLGGLPQGGIQRRGAVDALGDSERVGRSVAARGSRDVAGCGAEGA